MNTLHMGEFDSEQYWNDNDVANLPGVQDLEAIEIIRAMDEILFVLCKRDDWLVTRYEPAIEMRQYIQDLGWQIRFASPEGISEIKTSIFREMIEDKDGEQLINILKSCGNVSFYSIIEHAKDMLQHVGKEELLPVDPQIVRKVNSKLYSWKINQELKISEPGIPAYSADEVRRYGRELLISSSGKKLLIKHPFGVSGKGNLLVASETMLERIAGYLEKQVRQGKRVELLLEPFREKELDFSCHINIRKDGSYQLYGLQRMYNQQQAFSGVETATEEFYYLMEEMGYFQSGAYTVKQLYQSGYTGNVCIDSMLLKDQSLYPLVEINARKSMGFLNLMLWERFNTKACSSRLMFYHLKIPSNIHFSHVLEKLDQEKLLYLITRSAGIMPLSGNCMEINRRLGNISDKFYRGRFYYCVYFYEEAQFKTMNDKLLLSLWQLGIKKI